jgi:hypothetical protein
MAQRVPFIVAELGRDADPFMLRLRGTPARSCCTLYGALADNDGGSFPH